MNLPAVEDWQTEEQMTMEEHQDRTEETVSLTEDLLHTLYMLERDDTQGHLDCWKLENVMCRRNCCKQRMFPPKFSN